MASKMIGIMLNNIHNIWRKEIIDILRDRKALIGALIGPLFLGVMYAVLNPMLGVIVNQQATETIHVATIGLENADYRLLAMMSQFDIELEQFNGQDLTVAINEEKVEAGLIIPPDFQDNIELEGETGLTLMLNSAAGGLFGGQFATDRLQNALNRYNQIVVAERMAGRNVSLDLLTPVDMQVEDLATDAQLAGAASAIFLPMLVGLITAQGGMFIAIAATAGEKERGTLESLLVTPATDVEIFVGKLASVFTMTLVPVTLTLVIFWTVSKLLPSALTGGNVLPFRVVILSILMAMPLALVINVVLMIISIRTKAYKDAQSSVGPIILIAMMLSMAAAFVPPNIAPMFAIPIYGTGAIVGALAAGSVLPSFAILFNVVGSLIGAAIGIVFALRLFNRERLLYSM